MIRMTLILLSAALSSACASNSYCLSEQDYQLAQVAPEVQPVDELRLPTTGSSLRLPPEPEKDVPFGRKAEDGTGVCLDKPPRLVIEQAEVPASGETS